MTKRQRAVAEYLRDNGPTRQDTLAAVFGSTHRGIGSTLSALTWNDDVLITGERSTTAGLEATVWTLHRMPGDISTSAHIQAVKADRTTTSGDTT